MLVSGERWARALRCAALAPCLARRGFGDGVRLRSRWSSASATGGAAALASGTTLTGERTRGRRYGASGARSPSAPSAASRRTHAAPKPLNCSVPRSESADQPWARHAARKAASCL